MEIWVPAAGWLGCAWQMSIVWGDIRSDDTTRTDCRRFWLGYAAWRHVCVLACIGVGALLSLALSWLPPGVREPVSQTVVVGLLAGAVTRFAQKHERARRLVLWCALIVWLFVYFLPWSWGQKAAGALAARLTLHAVLDMRCDGDGDRTGGGPPDRLA